MLAGDIATIHLRNQRSTAFADACKLQNHSQYLPTRRATPRDSITVQTSHPSTLTGKVDPTADACSRQGVYPHNLFPSHACATPSAQRRTSALCSNIPRQHRHRRKCMRSHTSSLHALHRLPTQPALLVSHPSQLSATSSPSTHVTVARTLSGTACVVQPRPWMSTRVPYPSRP